MELEIFQEEKITNGVYTRGSAGYSVIAMDATSRHHSRVAVFYRLSPIFVVEAVHQFGPNFVGFQLEMREHQWYIVGY